ncbi:Mitochondrial distribution and morphology protein 31, mitochondrial precursor [Blastocladiella emersonii ATCC 22665]|nr:Mitochondrial distribution and morphology protein 31, mitochondrial precursor [Blastocladiella emersonii ATCC 22665]
MWAARLLSARLRSGLGGTATNGSSRRIAPSLSPPPRFLLLSPWPLRFRAPPSPPSSLSLRAPSYRPPPPPWAALRRAFSTTRTAAPRRAHSTSIPPDPPSLRSFFRILRWRFKVLFRRTSRPWTADELLAMFSWLFVGNSLFILVGTTSFTSVALWLANSLQFQEFVAYAVGWYLTRSTGATVIFESAIVPNWKDGKISLKNVTVRRMHALDESRLEPHYYYSHDPFGDPDDDDDDDGGITLSRGAADLAHADPDLRPPPRVAAGAAANAPAPWTRSTTGPANPQPLSRDENNFTKYELKIQSIDVTLDLVRWLDGKGLIRDAVIRGVRGIVDRRDVFWDDDAPAIPPRRVHQPGDFELERVVLDDLFVTVYNPEFRPYSLSVFQADLPRLRKQWLLYDIICATSLVGLFDNCLFSLHTPQRAEYGQVLASLAHHHPSSASQHARSPLRGTPVEGDDDDPFGASHHEIAASSRMTRFKIDGVPIEHLNYGTTGPFGWINGGTLDISALIHIPRMRRPQEVDELLAQLMTELKATAMDRIRLEDVADLPDRAQQLIRDKVNWAVFAVKDRSNRRNCSPSSSAPANQHASSNATRASSTAPPPATAAPTLAEIAASAAQPVLCMDFDLRFNNIRASVPLYSEDLSYLTTNALVRPVVAYMNAHRTFIPLRCRVALPLGNFDGAWTIYDSELSDALATAVGRAMVNNFVDDAERARRIRKVGLWSVRTVAESMTGLWQYVSGAKNLVHFLESVLRTEVNAAAASSVAAHPPGHWDDPAVTAYWMQRSNVDMFAA